MTVKRLILRYYLSLGISSLSKPNILKGGYILKQARIFSNLDVVEYTKQSYDTNPLHYDSQCAVDAGFKDILVPGLLIASLFPRIIASHFPGAVYVSQTLEFKLPVYIGEEIVGEIQATNIREMKKKYIAKFSTKCFKNDGLLVLDGEATAMLPTLAIKVLELLPGRRTPVRYPRRTPSPSCVSLR